MKEKKIFRLLNWSEFSGVNRLFVLWFEDNATRTRHTGYFLLKIEIKDDSVAIDGQKFFDQPVSH